MVKTFLLAATAGLALLSGAVRSDAATINYSSYTWSGGNVHITYTGSPSVTDYGGAGPITISNALGTVKAFCVDIFDWLQHSGSYTITAPTSSLSTADSNFIAHAANLIQLGLGGGAAGEAAQIAIWTLEYNGVDASGNVKSGLLTVTPDDSSVNALVSADFQYLGLNGATANAGYNASLGIVELLAGAPGNGNQNLITLPGLNPGAMAVPEPWSLATFAAGLVGLALFRSRLTSSAAG